MHPFVDCGRYVRRLKLIDRTHSDANSTGLVEVEILGPEGVNLSKKLSVDGNVLKFLNHADEKRNETSGSLARSTSVRDISKTVTVTASIDAEDKVWKLDQCVVR